MRILALVVSLAIVAFLFYQYMNKVWWNQPSLVPDDVETPTETIDYANEATRKFGLENCLRLCIISENTNQSGCQAECNDEFGQ